MKPFGKRGLTETVSEFFNLPAETAGANPVITVTGSRSVRVMYHAGILEYGAELISVNCRGMIVSVYGAKLEILSMNSEEMLIRGDISSVGLD
ncbi:MAG: YabP/YqfC family sporulation protein [Oscillospiraceae bacterium]|jgi:sporulation protein YqfC|nr:YabP/YqfC family sporulation protein [Oscillospiraceae bacterium]